MYSNKKMLPSPLIYYSVKPLLCIPYETKSWEKVSLMLSSIISWMLGELDDKKLLHPVYSKEIIKNCLKLSFTTVIDY